VALVLQYFQALRVSHDTFINNKFKKQKWLLTTKIVMDVLKK